MVFKIKNINIHTPCHESLLKYLFQLSHEVNLFEV